MDVSQRNTMSVRSQITKLHIGKFRQRVGHSLRLDDPPASASGEGRFEPLGLRSKRMSIPEYSTALFADPLVIITRAGAAAHGVERNKSPRGRGGRV